MIMRAFTLSIYNYASGEYEDVEVTEEVYNTYRRTEWNMDKNDSKHSTNTTPFSNLIGGDGGAYENFSEFISDEHNPVGIVMDKLCREAYSGSVVKTKKSGQVNEPDITTDFMPYNRIIARLLSAGKSQDREAFISVLTFACRQVQSPVRL